MIGQRTQEILRLRMDAKTRFDPGFVKGNHLFLYQSLTHKGTFGYADLHAALRECLAAHRAWHESRYPGGSSPWYFPSPEDKAKCVHGDSLGHALRRVTKAMGIPHRTPHGLRSFFVNVLRSQGKTDAEIALRIGHRSGGHLIVEVYGEILPHKLSWLPENGDPAWSVFKAGPQWSQQELSL
jgi:integrase